MSIPLQSLNTTSSTFVQEQLTTLRQDTENRHRDSCCSQFCLTFRRNLTIKSRQCKLLTCGLFLQLALMMGACV